MDHVCLRIDPFDAEALKAHLAEHGARLGELGLRYGADGYGQSLYLFDPEGNMVELKGPPEAARVTSL
jgi:glyoxylase I family protein